MSLERFRRGQSVHEAGFAQKLNDIIDAVEVAQTDIDTLEANTASSGHTHSGGTVTLSTNTPTSGLTGLLKASGDTLAQASSNVDYLAVNNPAAQGALRVGDMAEPLAGEVQIISAGGESCTLTSENGTGALLSGGTAVSLVGHAHAGSDITSGVVGTTYGGAGDVNGILKANGAGTVSAVAAGGIADNLLTSNVPLKNASNTITGAATLIKPAADSATAFQVQPSGSVTPVINVDTTNSRVGVGIAAPTEALDVVGGGKFSGNIKAGLYGNTLGSVSGSGVSVDQSGANNTISQIGLGYCTGRTYTPAAIGLITTDQGGSTKGDLIFGLRNATSDSVPIERLRITSGGLVGIGVTPTYSLHVAPASGATAAQTVFIQDATATTGKTGVVIKAGAGDGASDILFDVQNNAATSLFKVQQDGSVRTSGAFYGSNFANSASSNNGRLYIPNTGPQVTHNVADANPALLVNQLHASSTGNILTLQSESATKLAFTRAGAVLGTLAAFGDYANDGAAAAGGVAVGQFYRNGSVLMIRAA